MKGKRAARRAVSLAFTLLFALGPFASIAGAADADRRDDAYHFAFFADGEHDLNYAEWWYFNLFDSSQGLQLALTYAILDPANLSKFGAATVTAIAYTPGDQFTATAVYPPTSFYASYEQADVLVAGGSPFSLSYVHVLNDNVYHIVGSISQEHNISWDLHYVRLTRSWLASDRQHVGIFPWEEMSWVQYMPGAFVTGVVTVDGHTYHVANARGYHDHNWGEWLPFTVTWNWAQYFEPGIAFSIGDFRNSDAGVVRIDVLGKQIVFAKEQYALTHTRWNYDPVNGLWFPATTWLYAQNDDSALIVRMRAVDTLPVLPPPEIPLPLVPVIYEQTADFVGSFWEKNESGQWRLVQSFGGGGFKEYTDVTLPHPR